MPLYVAYLMLRIDPLTYTDLSCSLYRYYMKQAISSAAWSRHSIGVKCCFQEHNDALPSFGAFHNLAVANLSFHF